MTDAAHSSVVGGSSAERVINCPGSVLLAQTVPKKPASEFADRGSMLHKCMEYLIEDPDMCLEDLEGLAYNVEGDTLYKPEKNMKPKHIVTKELLDNKVEPAIEWFENDLDPDEIWVEQKVNFEDDIPGAFGTADIIYRKGNVFGIVDWKFGDGVTVKADDNSQMMFYLAGARSCGYFKACKSNKYRAHIYQPSDRAPEDEYHSVCDYTGAQLDKFEDSLISAVAVATAADAPMAPGDWCRWCPVNEAGQCPMLNSIIGTGVVKAPPRSMTPTQLGELLEIAELAVPWAKQVQKLAQESAEGGYPPPGWKLVEALGHSKFTDPQKAEDMMKRAGISMHDMYERKLVSPAQSKKLIKSADKPISRNWEKNIARPSLGARLVRESDKREAINPMGSLQNVANYLKVAKLTRKK